MCENYDNNSLFTKFCVFVYSLARQRLVSAYSCVFFSDVVRIFCSMFEIFPAISDKVSEKILLVEQQYAYDGSMLINLTKILRVPFCN